MNREPIKQVLYRIVPCPKWRHSFNRKWIQIRRIFASICGPNDIRPQSEYSCNSPAVRFHYILIFPQNCRRIVQWKPRCRCNSLIERCWTLFIKWGYSALCGETAVNDLTFLRVKLYIICTSESCYHVTIYACIEYTNTHLNFKTVIR